VTLHRSNGSGFQLKHLIFKKLSDIGADRLLPAVTQGVGFVSLVKHDESPKELKL
jgi:hypothetical protein